MPFGSYPYHLGGPMIKLLQYKKQPCISHPGIRVTILFVYDGYPGCMFIWLSKSLVNDPHVDLEAIFKEQIEQYAKLTPPGQDDVEDNND